MDCLHVHELFDDWLAGRAGAQDCADLERHLEDCAECATVAGVLRSGMAPTDAQVIRPVLSATTGSSCSRVQAVLAGDPSSIDGDLDRAHDHLPGCRTCREFSRVLEELPHVLPTLASRDPGPDFTAEVLLATLPRPSLWSVFLTRLRDHLERWQRRPEFAQELSFALTALLVLVCVMPGSPMREVPRHALSLVQVAEAEAVEGTVGAQLRQGLGARGERIGDGLDRIGTHVLGAGRGLVDGDLEVMGENAGLIGCDLRRLWTGVKSPAVDPDSICE